MNNKKLIVGLDLSFNSTGITIAIFDDFIGKKIQLHKVVFDDNSNKTSKRYTPREIKNLNITTYRLPSNLLVGDICFDLNDTNTREQCEITIKALICSKKIGIIVSNAIKRYTPDEIFFSIENYIMPTFSGPQQLKNVGGLITLQGYVREILIKLCLENKLPFKLYTPTPSSNKLIFSGNGSADKDFMLETFLKYYDGVKLLPTITEGDSASVNDVIDSFSLMTSTYNKIIKL